MDKNICTLLKEIKDALACGETQLAKRIGASQATVNRILNGQNNCLSSTYQSIFNLHKSLFVSVRKKKFSHSLPENIKKNDFRK